MAEVYDYVPGVPSSPIIRKLPNGSIKHSQANQLERVIALHADVQRKLQAEGVKIAERAEFRLTAVQARHQMRLREELAEAMKSGDPKEIQKAQKNIAVYNAQKTRVTHGGADVDYHISLFRPDGKAFFVEAGNSNGMGDGGLKILRKSLTG